LVPDAPRGVQLVSGQTRVPCHGADLLRHAADRARQTSSDHGLRLRRTEIVVGRRLWERRCRSWPIISMAERKMATSSQTNGIEPATFVIQSARRSCQSPARFLR